MTPCVIFENDDLLVVNKPAGINTHAPSPYAGEGLYEWLRSREPRWASLAIIHRLDKETSGVMVFAKTPRANRSLTQQFTRHQVQKKYLLLTDRPVTGKSFTVKSSLVRAGDRYLSRPAHAEADLAETRFRVVPVSTPIQLDQHVMAALEAEPVTGRTHQIRAHSAAKGLPIFGDILYGGTPAPRVFLHAAELTLQDPATGEARTFRAPAEFQADPRAALRAAVVDSAETDACRLVHGAADGWPDWYVDRLGDFLLSQSAGPLTAARLKELHRLIQASSLKGAYHKLLRPQLRKQSSDATCPLLVLGQVAPSRFHIRENGLRFELSFGEGYSVGLFLDQRDNRRRLLTGHVAADFSASSPPDGGRPLEILNTFAYTCGFSVCAARAGARTTNLDLSKKYLDWGRRNFELNQLTPADHDFIFGDVFDWCRRLHKKGRLFDAILLDPPTFSLSKESGAFRVEKDLRTLLHAALPLLRPAGVLFVSTNAAAWKPEKFMATVTGALKTSRRTALQHHFFPQPPDFPISRREPGYLKTLWLRVE